MFSTLRKLTIADVFTISNLFFGFLAVITGNIRYIFISAIMDGLDGMVARSAGSGEFGKELDSLADFFSFGFVPAFFLLKFYADATALAVAFFYVCCAMLRLARFNVTESRNFIGLPVTASALLLSSVIVCGKPELVLYLILPLSLAMICDITYPKIRSEKILLPASIFVVLAFFGQAVPLAVMCASYSILPLFRNLPGVRELWG